MRERYAGTFFGVQAALLGALVGLAVGGCNSAGVSPQCTPACPAGFLCTSTGCSPQAPPDLAASPDMALPCGGPCTVDAPYCDGSVCRPCLIDGHCPAGKVCRVVLGSLACVPGCSTDDRCGGGGARCCGGACTSPASDANNCGGCGNACPTPAHASASCQAGVCGASCGPEWSDCNGAAIDGCEVNLAIDPHHCGQCATDCSFAHGIAGCASGACYLSGCVPGWQDCNESPADGCEVDLSSDGSNCGGCGTSCMNLPHAVSASCVLFGCAISKCQDGWDDCDGIAANGCEAQLVMDGSCGGCGHVCDAGTCQVCDRGKCTWTPADCGACGVVCDRCHPLCEGGACRPLQCPQGFADCNCDARDWCEAETTSDPANCGGCGIACPLNQACIAGACQ